MPLDELVDLDAVPTLEDLTFPTGLDDWTTHPADDPELAGFGALPPIADPGFGPFTPAEALEQARAEAAPADPESEPADAMADEVADEVADVEVAGSGDTEKREGDGGWSAVA